LEPKWFGRIGNSAKKKRKKGLVMRKLFLMLAVLLVASAAYGADVTISCAQVGSTNEVTISYLASAEVNIPRAFALDIKLSNAETIYAVTPLDPNYWVYPGSYPSDPNGPVGNTGDSSDTLPGIDSNGVTIEMASLHSPPEVTSPNNPEVTNDLLSIFVTGGCDVNIVGNAARGKVVFYDATNEDDGRDVVYTGCAVSMLVCDDYCLAADICKTDYSQPGDGVITIEDYYWLVGYYGVTCGTDTYCQACDICDTSYAQPGDGVITIEDYYWLVGYFGVTCCQ
jgi:hypothetical protein